MRKIAIGLLICLSVLAFMSCGGAESSSAAQAATKAFSVSGIPGSFDTLQEAVAGIQNYENSLKSKVAESFTYTIRLNGSVGNDPGAEISGISGSIKIDLQGHTLGLAKESKGIVLNISQEISISSGKIQVDSGSTITGGESVIQSSSNVSLSGIELNVEAELDAITATSGEMKIEGTTKITTEGTNNAIVASGDTKVEINSSSEVAAFSGGLKLSGKSEFKIESGKVEVTSIVKGSGATITFSSTVEQSEAIVVSAKVDTKDVEELENAITVAAHNHTFEWRHDAEKHWPQITCSDHSAEKTDEKEDHSWDAGTVTLEPGCETTGTIRFTCTVCGEQKTEDVPVTGHKFSSAWTSDAENHWHASTCGHEVVSDQAAHTWNSGVVTTAPTFSETGIKTYTCTVCGKTKTEEIPATGDSEGILKSMAAAIKDKVEKETLYLNDIVFAFDDDNLTVNTTVIQTPAPFQFNYEVSVAEYDEYNNWVGWHNDIVPVDVTVIAVSGDIFSGNRSCTFDMTANNDTVRVSYEYSTEHITITRGNETTELDDNDWTIRNLIHEISNDIFSRTIVKHNGATYSDAVNSINFNLTSTDGVVVPLMYTSSLNCEKVSGTGYCKDYHATIGIEGVSITDNETSSYDLSSETFHVDSLSLSLNKNNETVSLQVTEANVETEFLYQYLYDSESEPEYKNQSSGYLIKFDNLSVSGQYENVGVSIALDNADVTVNTARTFGYSYHEYNYYDYYYDPWTLTEYSDSVKGSTAFRMTVSVDSNSIVLAGSASIDYKNSSETEFTGVELSDDNYIKYLKDNFGITLTISESKLNNNNIDFNKLISLVVPIIEEYLN